MIDVLKALTIIYDFCVSRENCSTCLIKEFCNKISSEWN